MNEGEKKRRKGRREEKEGGGENLQLQKRMLEEGLVFLSIALVDRLRPLLRRALGKIK